MKKSRLPGAVVACPSSWSWMFTEAYPYSRTGVPIRCIGMIAVAIALCGLSDASRATILAIKGSQ